VSETRLRCVQSIRMATFILSLAAVILAASFHNCPALESGNGNTGKWEMVWRYDEMNGIRTEFEALHDAGISFPFKWRVWNDTRGNRLQFLDDIGAEDHRVELGPGERALASEDGSSFVVLSPDSTARDSHVIHFFRRESKNPLWDAYIGGDPVLMANDGSLLLLAAPSENYDRFSRRVLDGSGRLQVIGCESGETLGEMPIYPTFARMTSDGERIALLSDHELTVLQSNGRLAWKTDVPVDNLVAREGLAHLATASDLVVVCGTGEEVTSSQFFDSLHPRRREQLLVFSTSGRLLWEGEQKGDPEVRFNLSCAISPDGSTLATLLDTDREQIVTAYDARTGDQLFVQQARRSSGSRNLSLSSRGDLICVSFADARTNVSAWDRQGTLLFEGALPLRSVNVTAHEGNLLTSDQWIVHILPEEPAK